MCVKIVCVRRAIFIVLCAFIFAAGAAARGSVDLVNAKTIDAQVSELVVTYRAGNIVFLPSDDDSFSFKEYMTSKNAAFFAFAQTAGGQLKITGGKRPWFRRIRASLEVYVPASFSGDYLVTLGSGNFDAQIDITSLGEAGFNVASGTMRLKSLTAPRIKLRLASGTVRAGVLRGTTDAEVGSGSMRVERLDGDNHRVKVESGNLEIDSETGRGAFSAKSGSITLGVERLTGDLRFDIASGNLRLSLPQNAAFFLDAETTSGGINIVSADGDAFPVKNRTSIMRPVGASPEHTITVRARSGNVSIAR